MRKVWRYQMGNHNP